MVDVAAKILFFGQDTRSSIPVLRRAGYSVEVFGSTLQVRPSIIEDAGAVAVALSGEWEPSLGDPISIARERARVPFILFGTPGKPSDQSVFDLVIPANRRPSQWLSEIDLLIRECQATCADARRVMTTSDLLRNEIRARIERSRIDRERSRLERESSEVTREKSRLERVRSRDLIGTRGRWDLEKLPGIADFLKASPIIAPCKERDRLNWSIMMGVAKMSGLLLKATKIQLENDGEEQIEALLAEERGLAQYLEDLLRRWKAHRSSHGC